jgi:hypothetical protein
MVTMPLILAGTQLQRKCNNVLLTKKQRFLINFEKIATMQIALDKHHYSIV